MEVIFDYVLPMSSCWAGWRTGRFSAMVVGGAEVGEGGVGVKVGFD